MTSVSHLRSPQIVMLLSNCFDPDPRVHNEARTLVENGYQVTIIAWDRENVRPQTEIVDGISIERVFVSSTHGRGITQLFVMPIVFLRMIRKALQRGFDLVHAHDFDTLPAALLLGRMRRKSVVYDSHEDYAGMLHGSVPSWLERLIRWTESILVRRVDMLLTVGETLRRQFELRGCRNAHILGNWKSVEEFQFPKDSQRSVRTELGIPENSLFILYISNLGRERHVQELLEAARQRPDVHVVIGGSGPSAASVQEYAAQHRNIHFLGFVKQKEIPRYTAASDAVYYGYDVDSPNARYSAPNKLFEALAAGRPLLTANFGEIGRIVTESQCGVILRDYSVQEILRGLDSLNDPVLLERLKAAASTTGVKEYNWSMAQEVLLSAYRRLIPQQPIHSQTPLPEVAAR